MTKSDELNTYYIISLSDFNNKNFIELNEWLYEYKIECKSIRSAFNAYIKFRQEVFFYNEERLLYLLNFDNNGYKLFMLENRNKLMLLFNRDQLDTVKKLFQNEKNISINSEE